MININYTDIIKKAERADTSPYQLIKRAIGYRKSKDVGRSCKVCLNLKYLEYIDWIDNRPQCCIIGESISKLSDIKLNYTCSVWVSING